MELVYILRKPKEFDTVFYLEGAVFYLGQYIHEIFVYMAES